MLYIQVLLAAALCTKDGKRELLVGSYVTRDTLTLITYTTLYIM